MSSVNTVWKTLHRMEFLIFPFHLLITKNQGNTIVALSE